MIKANSKFNFIQGNGVEAIAPANSKVYVHFADNGQGKLQIHGKILRIDQEADPENQPPIQELTSEIGWVHTQSEIHANDPDVFTKGHQAVIDCLMDINPEVSFSII